MTLVREQISAPQMWLYTEVDDTNEALYNASVHESLHLLTAIGLNSMQTHASLDALPKTMPIALQIKPEGGGNFIVDILSSTEADANNMNNIISVAPLQSFTYFDGKQEFTYKPRGHEDDIHQVAKNLFKDSPTTTSSQLEEQVEDLRLQAKIAIDKACEEYGSLLIHRLALYLMKTKEMSSTDEIMMALHEVYNSFSGSTGIGKLTMNDTVDVQKVVEGYQKYDRWQLVFRPGQPVERVLLERGRRLRCCDAEQGHHPLTCPLMGKKQ